MSGWACPALSTVVGLKPEGAGGGVGAGHIEGFYGGPKRVAVPLCRVREPILNFVSFCEIWPGTLIHSNRSYHILLGTTESLY